MAAFRVACLFLGAAVAARARDPTYEDWLEVEVLVQQEIDASTCHENHSDWDPNLMDHEGKLGDCRCLQSKRNPRPLGSRLLRLAFHDAAGRMDGFVNMSVEDNAGLDCATSILDDQYGSFNLSSNEPIKDVLDKSDFYAWAYIAAVRYAAFLQTRKGGAAVAIYPEIPITWGRVAYEPADGPAPNEAFPEKGGHSGYSELIQYFGDNFNYTVSEVVALMGAHTLGGARLDTSGFTGMWTQSKNILDEAYFSNMWDPQPLESCRTGECTTLPPTDCTATKRCRGWQQVQMGGAGNGFQWRHSCGETAEGEVDLQTCTHLMLNSDISLLYDIDGHINGTTGEITGYPGGWGTGKCSQAKFNQGFRFVECFSKRDQTADLVEDFAASLQDWLDAFALIFDKLIRRPYDNLAIVVPTSTVTSTTTDTCGGGSIVDTDFCPNSCADGLDNQDEFVACPACQSCWCHKGAGQQQPKCRSAGFIYNLR